MADLETDDATAFDADGGTPGPNDDRLDPIDDGRPASTETDRGNTGDPSDGSSQRAPSFIHC
jgi:hypothetical protein